MVSGVVPSAQHTFSVFTSARNVIYPIASTLKEVTAELYPYVGLIGQVGQGGMGVAETFAEGVVPRLQERRISVLTSPWQTIKEVALKVRVAQYHIVHGALFFGSGTLGTMLAAERVGWIDLGKHTPRLMFARDVLFLLGNVAATYFYAVRTERLASELTQCADPVHQQALRRDLRASTCGLLSAVGWILAAFATAISAPIALIFIFTVLASLGSAIPTIFTTFEWVRDRLH